MPFDKTGIVKKWFLLIGIVFALLHGGVSQARTWTEAVSGKQIEAEWVGADADTVTIVIKGGQTFTLPIAKLSAEDQDFIRQKLAPGPGSVVAKAEDRFDELGSLSAEKIPSAGEALPDLA